MDIVPSNDAAERTILGSILLDNELIYQAQASLRPEHFYLSAHQIIYKTMIEMSDKDVSIDYRLLAEHLGRNLKQVGGVAYLSELTDGIPKRVSIEDHINVVLDKAMKRSLQQKAAAIAAMVQESGAEKASEILAEAEQSLSELSESQGTELESVGSIATRQYKDGLHQFYKQGGSLRGLSTGLADLDDMLTGLKSELTIIAARPSMGKTALATCIAEHLSVVEGKVVAFFSLEMSREAIVDRMMFSLAKTNAHRVKSGTMYGNDEQKLGRALAAIQTAPLYIEDNCGTTPQQVLAKAKVLRQMVGLDCIIVDYLQLMDPGRKCENRTQEVSYISKALKRICRQLGVPVIALSQLNRGVEGRAPKDREPQLSDLRESGSIEQDADVVVMLHRPEYYDPGDEQWKGIAKALVRKQRNGPTGCVQLAWIDKCAHFSSLAKEEWVDATA